MGDVLQCKLMEEALHHLGGGGKTKSELIWLDLALY